MHLCSRADAGPERLTAKRLHRVQVRACRVFFVTGYAADTTRAGDRAGHQAGALKDFLTKPGPRQVQRSTRIELAMTPTIRTDQADRIDPFAGS